MFTTKIVHRNGNISTDRHDVADYNDVVAMLANWYYKSRIQSFEVNGIHLTENQMDEIIEASF